MRKFLPVITGILVGAVAAVTLINFTESKTVFGQEGVGWWNNMIASSETLDWGDVFGLNGAEKGKDLYFLVRKKLEHDGERKAMRTVASSYGLTLDEAKAVLAGSITPIFNNPDRKGAKLTQEDAYKLMAKIQEDFEIMNELMQIEAEVDTSISPSELFANDDLTDSGFDLVHDLSIIEEILFLDFTPSTVGAPYEDAIDSPYDPTLADQSTGNKDFVASEGGQTRLALTTDPDTGKSTLKVGKDGKEVDVEILDSDVCPVTDALLDSLNVLEDEQKAKEKEAKGEDADGDGHPDGDDDGDGGDNKDDDKKQAPLASKIQPAVADQWIEEWCPGEENSAGAGAGAELKSLGGVPSAGAGASADFSSEGVSANIALCIDLKLIKETISSYQPGDSCVDCEVEKINELLEKTLSHTLIPNKGTGNMLESAKCKKTGDVPLIKLQFISIWNPIPTPPNDDLIFGKNIFDEWNKFTERYQPVLFDQLSFQTEERPELSNDFSLQFQTQSALPGVSMSEILNRVNATKAEYKAEAETDVDELEGGAQVTDMLLYSENVLMEMRQMNALFTNFNKTYQKIIGGKVDGQQYEGAIKGLCSKKDMD